MPRLFSFEMDDYDETFKLESLFFMKIYKYIIAINVFSCNAEWNRLEMNVKLIRILEFLSRNEKTKSWKIYVFQGCQGVVTHW